MPDATATTTPETPPTTAAADSTPDGNATGDANPRGGDKLFSQAELDAIVKDRLKRAEEKAAAAQAKAQADAAAKALEEQGEFKKLADERAKSLDTVTAERDALLVERDDLKAKAGKYETSLKALLESHKAAIPEHVKPLLDRLDVTEQLQWIADNGDKVGVAGVPSTPRADGRGLSEEQKRAMQQQADRQYKSRF